MVTPPAPDELCDDDLARLATALGAPVVVDAPVTSGSSNVTWFVRVGDRPAVLRHPPRHRVTLPTAHDVLREVPVLRALASSAVPVPRVLAVGDDPAVLGVPFVLTERRAGTCLLTTVPGDLAPRALAEQAIDVLAAVHGADPAAASLDAPAGSHLERQIRRWRTQLARTPTAERLGDLDPLAGWLFDHRPAGEERTIIHGDYGFHNLLVSGAHIEAVLDWELWTLGDPVADLYSFLKSWGPAAHAPNPANDIVALSAEAPTRDELLDRYAARTGRDVHRHASFYEALGVWRSIGILEGIHARSNGARFAIEVPELVARLRAMMTAPEPR